MDALLVYLFFQIALESLPISSSGQLFILKKIFNINFNQRAFDIIKSVMHGPTILILTVFFWKEWSVFFFRLITFFRNSFYNYYCDSYNKFFKIFLKIVLYVFVADSITTVFYVIFRVWLRDFYFFKSSGFVLSGFVITMILLISLIKFGRSSNNNKLSNSKLNLKKVLIIGLVQGIALLPGISRFGSTYAISRILNISHRRAFQFSFLIQVPLISAAFLVASYKSLSEPEILSFYSLSTLSVAIIATIVGYYLLKFAANMGANGKFWKFGIYLFVPIFVLAYIIYA